MPRRARWKDDLDDWERALQEEFAPVTTIDTYIPNARAAYRWGTKNGWPDNPRKLEPAHIYAYYDHIQGLRSKTQATYMASLMAFVKHVRAPNVANMRIRIKAERGEVYWLEKEQVLHLFRTAPFPRCLAAEVIMACTGIREIELRSLRSDMLTRDWLHVSSGKGRRARKIPLDQEFWDLLEPYTEWRAAYAEKWGDSPYYLVHPERGLAETGPLLPYRESSISRMLKAHGDSQGIEHANAHSWRRFFGRDLYYNQCPPTQIQRYYGHVKLEQTMQYIGVTEEMDQAAMRRYRSRYLPHL